MRSSFAIRFGFLLSCVSVGVLNSGNMKRIIYLLVFSGLICSAFCDEEINRSHFPDGFLFGTSTSAFQIEGAVHEDGRGPNNWDVFTHVKGNSIPNGLNADVADDHYHRWKDDVELMHSLGVNAYRFSVSWSRILPRGRFGRINYSAIMFYSKLIDRLLLNGIEPFVTISHNDVPHELEARYSSWLSPLIQEDFAYFADICFRSFGDKVKYWATLNEPILFTKLAYINGNCPPSRCSSPFGNCSTGNSDIEPLMVVHNMILSHTKAANIYRKHYQPKQGGYIGIVADASWYEPYKDDDVNHAAASRALAFNVAWLLDPLIHGDYPGEMRQYLGSDLPTFSAEESNNIKDSLDFIGINHYTSYYAKDCVHSPCDPSESHAISGYFHPTDERDGVPIGERTAMPLISVVPYGMEKIIEFLKTRYNNKPMFVTENGYPGYPDVQSESVNDTKRVEYHKSYLASLARAIERGADVRGYFIWSLMDNFEWISGYDLKFGLHYVDFQTLEHIPRLSAKWYKSFLRNDSESINKNITRTPIGHNFMWKNMHSLFFNLLYGLSGNSNLDS